MYFNPYLQDRLANQHIEEALHVAKLDYLLKGESDLSRYKRRKMARIILVLPLMILQAPFQWGVNLLRRI